MNKFFKERQPLTLLKHKLMLKSQAAGGAGYGTFVEELEGMLKEQGKFTDALEFKLAEAEALDKAQATWQPC